MSYKIIDTTNNKYVDNFYHNYSISDNNIYIPKYSRPNTPAKTLDECINLMLLAKKTIDIFKIVDENGKQALNEEQYNFVSNLYCSCFTYVGIIPYYKNIIKTLTYSEFIIFLRNGKDVIDHFQIYDSKSIVILPYDQVGENLIISMDKNSYIKYKLLTDHAINCIYDVVNKGFVL